MYLPVYKSMIILALTTAAVTTEEPESSSTSLPTYGLVLIVIICIILIVLVSILLVGFVCHFLPPRAGNLENEILPDADARPRGSGFENLGYY